MGKAALVTRGSCAWVEAADGVEQCCILGSSCLTQETLLIIFLPFPRCFITKDYGVKSGFVSVLPPRPASLCDLSPFWAAAAAP